jgi:hypothetical protein
MSALAHAPRRRPDGYTICILNAEPIAYNQFLLKSMPFDPEKGLQPVTDLYHLIQTLRQPALKLLIGLTKCFDGLGLVLN